MFKTAGSDSQAKVRDFCTFSFIPIDPNIPRALFRAHLAIPTTEQLAFETRAQGYDSLGEPRVGPTTGSMLKAHGKLSIHFDASQVTDTDVSVTKELEKTLRSLKGLFSPKLRIVKGSTLEFLVLLEIYEQAIQASQNTLGVERINSHSLGAPELGSDNILTFLSSRSSCVFEHLGGFHADTLPGTKTVVSNIPTKFLDRSSWLEANSSSDSVTPLELDEVAPHPYEVARFDMSITEHSPPKIERGTLREFLSISHQPVRRGPPGPML